MPDNNDDIIVEMKGRILHIVMNRPERKNAINLAMYNAIADAIDRAVADAETRVILIRGAAGCFTSGNDLEDFMGNPPVGSENPVTRFMATLYNCPKPVVAAVQGSAVGIGSTLLLHCDLVYAGESAKLQLPFTNLGLCPEFASSYVLPRMIGHAKAAELLLLGEPFSAAKAESCGIVNSVVSDDKVLAVAETKCERLADQAPTALQITKSLLKQHSLEIGRSVMDKEMALFNKGLRSGEFAEAISAFFEKRKPDFN